MTSAIYVEAQRRHAEWIRQRDAAPKPPALRGHEAVEQHRNAVPSSSHAQGSQGREAGL